jgi:hypothetical protein
VREVTLRLVFRNQQDIGIRVGDRFEDIGIKKISCYSHRLINVKSDDTSHGSHLISDF